MSPEDPEEGDYDEETDTYYSDRFGWVSLQFYQFLTKGGYSIKDKNEAIYVFLKSQGLADTDSEDNNEESSQNNQSEDSAPSDYYLEGLEAFANLLEPLVELSPFTGSIYSYNDEQMNGGNPAIAGVLFAIVLDGIPGGGSCKVQFGKTANQIYHAFRHVDDLGLDRVKVQKAIITHFKDVGHRVVAGKPFNQVVTVDGHKIQYTAYKLSDGTINIGRIHGVK